MNNKLYVGNLSYDTSEASLRELFSKAGAIRSISIPMDRVTNRRVVLHLSRWKPPLMRSKPSSWRRSGVDGRTIKVNEARPQEARSGGGDRGPRRNDSNRW